MEEKHPVCRALAVHCIDFRIQRALNEYLDERFSAAYDRVAAPGGVKYLVDGGQEGSVKLAECAVSYQLHHPETFALIQHEDCGAYGGSGEFDGFAAEQVFQKEQLQKAEQVLREQFPSVSVEKILVCLSGEIISL
jgi:hypothetical protein